MTDPKPCQALVKAFRQFIVTASPPRNDAIIALAKYFLSEILPRQRGYTRRCKERVRRAIEEYISVLESTGDRKRAWEVILRELAHEIDLDYQYYGITQYSAFGF
jgi:hypothetical protein